MSPPSDLPAPLVPSDTDMSGLPAFMLDVERLFASELWALSTGEEFKAAVALWGRAWQQVPAGSLPNDDRLLAAFSAAGPRWKRVREVALRGFILCADGRLYHRTLCADVMRAAKSKEDRRLRTVAATKARLARADHDDEPPSGGKKLNGINKTAPRDVERHEERDEPRHDDRHDIRHEQRDGPQMSSSRGSLRSPIDRTGHNSREIDTGPACDPVPREAGPGRAWASRENFDRVERRCREALPDGGPQDLRIGPIAKLEADGLDLEAEIVPNLLDVVAAARVPIRTWAILADRVAERVALQRQTRRSVGLAAVPAAPPSPDSLIDLGSPFGAWSEDGLALWIAKHRQHPPSWPDNLLGPPPGHAGCRIPARLLIAEAA